MDAESLIGSRRLVKALKTVLPLLSDYLKICDAVDHVENTENQLEQRSSVESVNLSGTSLSVLSDFKVLLLAKIDNEICRLTEQIASQMDELGQIYNKISSLYTEVGNICNAETHLNGSEVESDHVPCSVEKLMANFDAVCLLVQQDLARKGTIFQGFHPGSEGHKKLKELRRIWRIRYSLEVKMDLFLKLAKLFLDFTEERI